MSGTKLPEQLDIRHIADARRAIEAMLSPAESDIELDAGDVTRIDTSGVQLIAAALRAPPERRVALVNPAPCVVEAFTALGLAHLLNL